MQLPSDADTPAVEATSSEWSWGSWNYSTKTHLKAFGVFAGAVGVVYIF